MPEVLDPKERLLDAGEAVFAEYGFDGTSLRTITAAAGANIAAVNYHFGSKEALFQAVFARRVAPMNAERLAMLDAVESAAGDGPLELEAVLVAFLRPAIRLRQTQGGRSFMRLAGRMYLEPGERLAPVLMQFEEVKRRFAAALRRAVPDVPEAELIWRMHFAIGAMCHVLVDTQRLAHFSNGACDPDDEAGVLARLVQFVGAGLRAAANPLSVEARS